MPPRGSYRRGPAARNWWGLRWPAHWWTRQSLRARLTLVATALFACAVATGAVLLLILQRYSLTRVLDSSAQRTATDIAHQIEDHPSLRNLAATTGGITSIQVVDSQDRVIAYSLGADHVTPVLDPTQLAQARTGTRFDIANPTADSRLRVYAKRASGGRTVLVATDLSRVDDSQRILARAAIIGSPIAVLLMGFATYVVVALTLRPVAALRHGAADITAAGLADQRLPVPSAQDEIHRLAVTLNAMLDRIDSATARQRTFVGDAAHELRSPLASLRVQLEVAQRMGADSDWSAIVDDVMVDVDRLDRLVGDLLTLARMDEARELRREPVRLDDLVRRIVEGYEHGRVPVTFGGDSGVVLDGDPDGLHRIVVNLIDNAVRYATTQVDVQLHTRTRSGQPIARLTVTDDGPGIAPADRARVFDRFYRTEQSRAREYGGTGLGLSIVRDLARAHGGRVRLADRPDGKSGLQAIVTLPLQRD